MMDGGASIDVPVIGRTKTAYVYGAVALAVGIVGYAYWQRSQGGTADPSYYADLRTGSDTGSDAYTGANDSVSGNTGSDSYDALPKTPTTDQEWTNAVVERLSFLEPDYAYGVLGKYLAKQPITTVEAVVVRSAWAAVGHPPGNQQIILGATTSTPGTPTATVPTKAPSTPTGLRVDAVTSTDLRIGWNPSVSAAGYHVYWSTGQVTQAGGTAMTTRAITPGKTLKFQVDAYNSKGRSRKSAPITVHVPGKK